MKLLLLVSGAASECRLQIELEVAVVLRLDSEGPQAEGFKQLEASAHVA